MNEGAASTMEAVRAHVSALSPGEPFTSSDLLPVGTRASVDQALARLVRAGAIERIARGVFVRPSMNPYVGKVPPAPEKVAKAVARSSDCVIEVHGAEAAREFGLTTQVPMRPVYLTSGRSRIIHVGGVDIHMRHVANSRLLLAGRPAGRAFAALMYLGKDEVAPGTIEAIKLRLTPAEFEALASSVSSMPSWLSDAFYRHRSSKRAAAGDGARVPA
jgi:hypothetical protein